jgi:hypothetical protein
MCTLCGDPECGLNVDSLEGIDRDGSDLGYTGLQRRLREGLVPALDGELDLRLTLLQGSDLGDK